MRALFVILCSVALVLIGGGASPLLAQSASPALSTNLPLVQLSSNLFQLGTVRFDKAGKTVHFPVRLNMNQGPLEYILVTKKGKLHESLFQCDVEPSDLQLALLLLGAKGAPPTVELQTLPHEPYRLGNSNSTNNLFARIILSGGKISIDLTWKTDKGEQRQPIENFVWNQQTKTSASRGPWIYNGSRVVNGTFMAQREGSIIALVDDVEALINNPRLGHDNDEIWTVNTNNLPPTNTTLEMSLKLH